MIQITRESPAIDAECFKQIMASAPGPAAVVTAIGADGTPQGLTVSAVCSVSLEPPLVLACVDRRSNTLAAIRYSRSFTVNYLSHGRESVALGFATKSSAKYDGHVWSIPRSGVGGPVLHEYVAAYAACRVTELIAVGDHVIVVGQVLDGDSTADRRPLAYVRQTFFTTVGS